MRSKTKVNRLIEYITELAEDVFSFVAIIFMLFAMAIGIISFFLN